MHRTIRGFDVACPGSALFIFVKLPRTPSTWYVVRTAYVKIENIAYWHFEVPYWPFGVPYWPGGVPYWPHDILKRPHGMHKWACGVPLRTRVVVHRSHVRGNIHFFRTPDIHPELSVAKAGSLFNWPQIIFKTPIRLFVKILWFPSWWRRHPTDSDFAQNLESESQKTIIIKLHWISTTSFAILIIKYL